jgi:hypothetical protein
MICIVNLAERMSGVITRVKEPCLMSQREVDQKYDGKWVLFDNSDISLKDGLGYVIAYCDEEDVEDHTDFNHLMEISAKEFNGNTLIIHGYKYRGREMLHVL